MAHEIQNYAWAKDKDGRPTDKPEHDFSHSMDSLRYIDADTSELLEKEFRRLQVWGALEQAVKLARLYGGSIILMGTAAPDPTSRLTRAKPSSACGSLTATKQSRPRRDGP